MMPSAELIERFFGAMSVVLIVGILIGAYIHTWYTGKKPKPPTRLE